MKEIKEHNIKLQSIPAFFPDARADAHEKMRVRLQFFFVSGYKKNDKNRRETEKRYE